VPYIILVTIHQVNTLLDEFIIVKDVIGKAEKLLIREDYGILNDEGVVWFQFSKACGFKGEGNFTNVFHIDHLSNFPSGINASVCAIPSIQDHPINATSEVSGHLKDVGTPRMQFGKVTAFDPRFT
jgi:hypothetical protein